jgi:hypothetical protein
MKLTCQELSDNEMKGCKNMATHLVNMNIFGDSPFIVCDKCAKFYSSDCCRKLTEDEVRKIISL